MTIYFVQYDPIQDSFKGAGSCPDGQLANQAVQGWSVVQVLRNAMVTGAPDAAGNVPMVFDIGVVREAMSAKVDHEAGEVRKKFMTDIPGQELVYMKKETEARTWVSSAPSTDFPFMNSEAQLTGIPIATVRASIMAQVIALTVPAAKVETHRVVAKRNIVAATTIATIVASSNVDWNAVLAS